MTLLLAALFATVIPQDTLCRRIDVPGPPARIIAALAWHAGSGEVVLFGGDVLRAAPRADTWLWDGASWREVAGPGPEARYGHALVADESRGVLVLTGGFDKVDTLFDDHWEWDGRTWRRGTAGAPARRSAAVAWDASTGLVLQQGGNLWRGRGTTDGFATDTWLFDGRSWRRAAAEGPEGRYGAGAAWDPLSEGVLLFGGNDHDGHVYDDTWLWRDGRWTRLAVPGPVPAPRGGPLLVSDRARRGVVLFGGFRDDTVFTDVWRWDGARWHAIADGAIPALIFPALAWDAGRGVAVLVGQAAAGDGSVQTWECRLPGGQGARP